MDRKQFNADYNRFQHLDFSNEQEVQCATTWLESLDDEHLEELWEDFGDVAVFDRDAVKEMQAEGNYDLSTEGMHDDEIDEDWLIWPRGTGREEVWHWFDDQYSQGVVALMGVA